MFSFSPFSWSINSVWLLNTILCSCLFTLSSLLQCVGPGQPLRHVLCTAFLELFSLMFWALSKTLVCLVYTWHTFMWFSSTDIKLDIIVSLLHKKMELLCCVYVCMCVYIIHTHTQHIFMHSQMCYELPFFLEQLYGKGQFTPECSGSTLCLKCTAFVICCQCQYIINTERFRAPDRMVPQNHGTFCAI